MRHPSERELYDLREDPHEMNNLVSDPAMQGILAGLEDELAALVLEAMGLTGN